MGRGKLEVHDNLPASHKATLRRSSALNSEMALLSAAKTLFATRGYEGVTVKEIADAAGVNIGLISYYFGSKMGIYRHVLEKAGMLRLAASRRILVGPDSKADLEIRLQLFAQEVIDAYLEDPELTHIIHRECEDNLSPETEDVFRKTFLKSFETLESFFQRARSKGLMRRQLNPHMAALHFFGSLVQSTHRDRTHQKYFGSSLRDAQHRDLWIHHLVGIFLEGARKC